MAEGSDACASSPALSAGSALVLPARDASRAQRLLRAVRRLFAAIAERPPIAVPLSPTTRGAVNTQQAHSRQCVALETLPMAAHVARAGAGYDGAALTLLVDAAVPVRLRLYARASRGAAGARETSPQAGSVVSAALGIGLRQRVVVPLAFGPDEQDSSVVQRHVFVQPETDRDSSVAELSVVRIEAAADGAQRSAWTARVCLQRAVLSPAQARRLGLAVDERRRAPHAQLEMLEIYGQRVPPPDMAAAAEVRATPAVAAPDAGSDAPQDDDHASADAASVACPEAPDDECGAECVICLTADRDTLLLPCRHLCICLECAETLGRGDGKCPLCRQPYASMVTVSLVQECAA